MQRLAKLPRPRRAVAAVEFAVILPFLMIVLVGIWEVGRLVHVQQILNNSAREGARLAAQGLIVNKDSEPTLILVDEGSPNVKTTIENYLREAGIDPTGLTLSFKYLDGDKAKTQPHQATKGQKFRVYITLPMANVRWTLLSLTSRSTKRSPPGTPTDNPLAKGPTFAPDEQ
jgi:Flp pilus assembly protein TadG